MEERASGSAAFVVDPGTGMPVGPPVGDRPATRPDPDVALTGTHASLRRLDAVRHADELAAALNTPETDPLWLYLAYGPFPDRPAFRRHVEQLAASSDPLVLAITPQETGTIAGYAALMRIEPAHRSIEIGHVLFGPGLRRTPAATEAIFLLAEYVFELGFRRLEWKCDALNEASRRAAARFGFTYEGTFRQHMIVKGRSRDTAWFSITDAEWPARRAAFESWLAPDNFDRDGRQKLSLLACRGAATLG